MTASVRLGTDMRMRSSIQNKKYGANKRGTHLSNRYQTAGFKDAYEINNLRPSLSIPPITSNKSQGILEPWTDAVSGRQ